MKLAPLVAYLAIALSLPAPALADDALREQGRKLLDGGEAAEAESVLDRATKATPKDADAWFLLGRAHLATERYKDAAEAFEAAFRLDSERQDALYNLAHAQRKSQGYAKAAESYRLFLQRNPGDADAYYGLAETLVAMKDKLAAADAYDRYADNEKVADRKPWVEKARGRATQLREEAAEEKARKAAKARDAAEEAKAAGQPAPAPVAVAAASPAPAAHRPEAKAVVALEAMRPDSYRKGVALVRQSSFPEALQLLEQAAQAKPEDPFVLAALGAALLGTRDFGRAQAAYARALELSSEAARPGLRFGLAEAKRQQGDEAGAKQLYTQVAEDAGANAELKRVAALRARGE